MVIKEFENLSGRTFGSWTVKEHYEVVKGQRKWLCECKCGTKRMVYETNLKRGLSESCGCLSREKAKEKRDYKGSVIWHCRCDCGNEIDLSEDALVHGHWQSCGCGKEQWKRDGKWRVKMVDGTCVEWLEKRKHRRDNTSGFRGVYITSGGKYLAAIGFKGATYYLGRFGNMEEAIKVRLEAEKLVHDGFVQAYREWTEKREENPEWAKEHPLIFEVEQREDRSLAIRREPPEINRNGKE